jgi:hypothetical protein
MRQNKRRGRAPRQFIPITVGHRHTDPAEDTQTVYIHTQDIPHSDIYATDELNYLLQFQKNIWLLRLAQLPYQHFINTR